MKLAAACLADIQEYRRNPETHRQSTQRRHYVAEFVRPKLIHDGLFLVGLDFVGDKIPEINDFTPGGLLSICDMYETDFAATVLVSLEKKLEMGTGKSKQIVQPGACRASRILNAHSPLLILRAGTN